MNASKSGGQPELAAIGFSTRALVAAANTIGYRTLSLDAFADFDCARAAWKAVRIDEWGTPPGVQCILRSLADAGNPPVLLAGGCENWLELAQALDGTCRVLGPSPGQLEKLRSPQVWKSVSTAAGLKFPDIAQGISPAADPAGWLTKSAASAGGIHVKRPTARGLAAGQYYQRFVPGRTLGVNAILAASGPKLIGVTESYSCDDWPGPSEFIYRGSWGPVELDALTSNKLVRLCECVQAATGLAGWVQFDFIQDNDGLLWLLEINPRWAAGMEILTCTGIPVVRSHLAAHGIFSDALADQPSSDGHRAVRAAKAVFYADHDILLTEQLVQRLQALPSIADVPSIHAIGEIISRGHPLLTLTATATSEQSDNRGCLLDQLRLRREKVQQVLL